jgi:hypothetical protein
VRFVKSGEDLPMPKVFGLHEIELQPGVEPEEYERVFAEEIASSFTLRGWKPIF